MKEGCPPRLTGPEGWPPPRQEDDDMDTLQQQATAQLTAVMAHWTSAVQRLDPGAQVPADSVLANRATVIVAGLADGDPSVRHESLISLIPWLGHDTMPVGEGWWTSPLGLLAAAAEQDDGDEWVTQQQAADACGVSRWTISDWIADGRLEVKPGGPTGGRMVSRRDAARIALERSQV